MKAFLVPIALLSAATLAVACAGNVSTKREPPQSAAAEQAAPSRVEATRLERRNGVPSLASSQFEAGLILQAQGRLAEAIAKYDSALRLAPDFALAYTNRGRAYIVLRQYDKAVEDLDLAIRLDPDNAIAHSNRGLAYWRQGQPDRALDELNEAIRLDPSMAFAYVDRGMIYGGLGKNERAKSEFDAALKINPGFALAYYNRAIAHASLGDDAAALDDVERAVQLGISRSQLESIIEEVKGQR